MKKELIKSILETSELMYDKGNVSATLMKSGDFDKNNIISNLKKTKSGKKSLNKRGNTIIFANIRGMKEKPPSFMAPHEHLGFPIRSSF